MCQVKRRPSVPSTSTSIPPSGLPKRKNIILDRMRTEAQSEALRMRPNCTSQDRINSPYWNRRSSNPAWKRTVCKDFLNFWGNKTCSEDVDPRDNPCSQTINCDRLGVLPPEHFPLVFLLPSTCTACHNTIVRLTWFLAHAAICSLGLLPLELLRLAWVQEVEQSGYTPRR